MAPERLPDVTAPFEQLIAKFSSIPNLRLPIVEELKKLCRILPHDLEVAAVRGRRITDIIVRHLHNERFGGTGTAPLDSLISTLERGKVIPREVAAHARSLKDISNLCAHEAFTETEDISQDEALSVCLIDLAVILKWFVRSLEEADRCTPSFRAVDGLELCPGFTEIEDILLIDRKCYGELPEEARGCRELSMRWFGRNPQIYTLLYCGRRIVGYCNVMPLERDALSWRFPALCRTG